MKKEKKNLKIISNDIGIFMSVHVRCQTRYRKSNRDGIAIPQAVAFPQRATARRGVTPETGDPSHSYQEADRCPRE